MSSSLDLQGGAIALLVVSMMLAVGLQVPLAALAQAARDGRWLARTLAVNVLAVPALGAALAWSAPVPPAVAAALVLCATAPGGPLGPVFAGLAGGDLPLATAVMIVLALASVVATPLLASAALPAAAGGDLGAWPLFETVVVFQIVPLAGGMALRHRWPHAAARLAPGVARASHLVLIGVVAGLLATRGAVLAEIGIVGLGVMSAFVLACLFVGAGLDPRPARARALALCTGVRNLALALLVAAAHLRDPAVDAALLAFGFLMLAAPLLLALWWRRRVPAAAEATAEKPLMFMKR